MNYKMKSRRWWIVIWAICYITSVTFFCIAADYDISKLAGVLAVIGGIIVSYMTISSMKKKKE